MMFFDRVFSGDPAMTLMIKDPDARLDVGVDWAALYLSGQVLTASSWSVEPVEAGGIAVPSSSFNGGKAAATLSGGLVGASYRVTNRATLSDGQIDERSFHIRVEQQ
jgi:hypothetical protein